MNDRIKDAATGAAVGAGTTLAAKGLKAIFDRAASKRPNGLVGRWRRFWGYSSETKSMPDLAKEYVDERYKEKHGK